MAWESGLLRPSRPLIVRLIPACACNFPACASILRRVMTEKAKKKHDGDALKGAVESQAPKDTPERTDFHSNLADQLPHRNSGENAGSDFEGADSDFPEPGSNPEHSGQRH